MSAPSVEAEAEPPTAEAAAEAEEAPTPPDATPPPDDAGADAAKVEAEAKFHDAVDDEEAAAASSPDPSPVEPTTAPPAPPPPPPLALHPANQPASSIVSSAAAMTTSTTPAPPPPSDDAAKPNLSTVAAIVNQVLAQKEGGATNVDIAALASKEVHKFYDGTGDEEAGRTARAHPWNQKGGEETRALYPNSPTPPPRTGSFKRRPKGSPAAPQYEFDPYSQEFNDLCEELGIDARSHPHLRRPYRVLPPPGTWMRSKVCQYCLIVTCLVGVAIGVAVGVSQGMAHARKRQQELHPYYIEKEKEMENAKVKEKEANVDKQWWAKENAEELADEGGEPSREHAPQEMAPEELEALYYKLEDAYLPMWFDRSSGWEGTTYKEAVDFCRGHDDFVPCPYEVYCPEQTMTGRLIFGEVFSDRKDVSWAPILDAWNEWVQVGNGLRQCAVFSDVYHQRPNWGFEGHGKNDEIEKLTGHIMCCLEKPLGDDFEAIDVPTQPDFTDVIYPPQQYLGGPPMNSDSAGGPPQDVTGPSFASSEETLTPLEKQIQSTYRPFWFDTNDGWSGGTYDDAREFCESIPDGPDGETFHLCPMKVYCPRGLDVPNPLIYEMEAFVGFQWAPVSNDYNKWVMVGEVSGEEPRTCQTFLETYHREPDWGIDGTQSMLKQHILCCQVYSPYDGGVQKGDIEEQPSQEGLDSNVPVVQMTQTDVVATPHQYLGSSAGAGNEDQSSAGPHAGEHSFDDPIVALKKALNPTWYEASGGWGGGSHNDALGFCSSKGQELCPYAAYCPHGPKKPALEGASDEGVSSTQWAPTINKPSEWIMVGMLDGREETQCVKYGDLNEGIEPPWGSNGSNSEVKRFVLCCTPASSVYTSAQPVGTKEEEAHHTGAGNSAPHAGEHNFDDQVIAMKSTLNPIWYSKVDDGWSGGSHTDALDFCAARDKELCPYAAYCPHGSTFPSLEGSNVGVGEVPYQWSPVINKPNQWVLIGVLHNDDNTQCKFHEELNGGNQPPWGLDASMPELKNHVMCCSKTADIAAQVIHQPQQQQQQQQQQSDATQQQEPAAGSNGDAPNHFEPATATKKVGIWFDSKNGWNSGSHDDASHFCAMKEVNGKRMELCPYHEYCPSGPSRPPVDGREAHDGEESEQWAPTSNGDNQWVMVGMHGKNKATQCLTHGQLNGAAPSWGLDNTNQEKKHSIMCCYVVEDA